MISLASIREVWEENLEEEMARIREVVLSYNFVAMDTEFPGVVASPMGNFKSNAEYNYQTLRCNVDLLKIIQLGLTFSNARGELPPGVCTWQFNFKFDLNDEMYAEDSINLLQESGIDFEKMRRKGIDVNLFGELFISSGLVLDENIRWISFHSGYDFAYLMKVLMCKPMPTDETSFYELLHLYFPCIYDIKYLMKACKDLKGGLDSIADTLEMQLVYFDNYIDSSKYAGVLYGLSLPYQIDSN